MPSSSSVVEAGAGRYALQPGAGRQVERHRLLGRRHPDDLAPGHAVLALEVALGQHRERRLVAAQPHSAADEIGRRADARRGVHVPAGGAEQAPWEHRNSGERLAPIAQHDVGAERQLADVELAGQDAVLAIGAVAAAVVLPDVERGERHARRRDAAVEERDVAVVALQRQRKRQVCHSGPQPFRWIGNLNTLFL